jgi:hypothetical protein
MQQEHLRSAAFAEAGCRADRCGQLCEVRWWDLETVTAAAKDNGFPGYRDYSPGYFAPFVIDPDGTTSNAFAGTVS